MKDFFTFYSAPCETTVTQKMINESANDPNGLMRIEAVFQDLGKVNRNGRVYTKENMAKMLQTPRLLELLATKSLKGEFGHPSIHDIERQKKVEPTMVCHRILDLRIEGDLIVGKAEQSGPYGAYFKEDVLAGEKIAFSFRGLGEGIKNSNGTMTAVIACPVTWDRVYYPSHKCAYMTNICESADMTINGNILLSESFDDILHESTVFNESLNNFVKEESAKIKRINQAFDEALKFKSYNESTNIVTMVNEGGDKICFTLDDYVLRQLV